MFFSRIDGLDKIIYLDSDTVVVGSLRELWKEELSGYYMGVVETLPTRFYKELDLPKGDRFFNDGMAICNVAYCRENNLIKKVLEVVKNFNGNPPTLSEGALNKVCYGRVKYISPRYNLMAGLLYMCNLDVKYMSQLLHYSEGELRNSCSNPVVIHFLTAFYNRPWFKGCTHPYKIEYYKYKAMSPWKDANLIENPLPLKLRVLDFLFSHIGLKATLSIGRLKRRLRSFFYGKKR